MESNTERMLKPKIKRKVDRKEVMDAFSDCFMSVERTIRRTNDKDGDILFFSVGEWIARRSLEEKHADDLELIFDIGLQRSAPMVGTDRPARVERHLGMGIANERSKLSWIMEVIVIIRPIPPVKHCLKRTKVVLGRESP